MIVVDASSWCVALVDAGPSGDAARRVLSEDPDWMTPAHAPVEVLRTLRRFESRGLVTSSAADQLGAEVIHAEVRCLAADRALLSYVWQQRHTLSPYDAPYVGLAARYGIALVTSDVRLARAAEALQVSVVVPS